MEKRMLTSQEICSEMTNTGVKKGTSSFPQLLILGILAGIFIALGGFASAVFSHSIENPGIAKFASGIIFPVGLMFVIICGGELFTGNTLIVTAMYEGKISFGQVLRNWIIVYFANFIGAFIIAFLVINSGSLGFNAGKLGGYAIKVAAAKGGLSFISAFSSGILCNILVCLAVWGSYAAKDIAGKVLIIWFPVMAFVVSGFEHSVANMYYFSIGILAKSNPAFIDASHVGDKISNVNWSHAIENLIPVTLGNIIGGAVFVGTAYWLIYRYFPSVKASKVSENIKG